MKKKTVIVAKVFAMTGEYTVDDVHMESISQAERWMKTKIWDTAMVEKFELYTGKELVRVIVNMDYMDEYAIIFNKIKKRRHEQK